MSTILFVIGAIVRSLCLFTSWDFALAPISGFLMYSDLHIIGIPAVIRVIVSVVFTIAVFAWTLLDDSLPPKTPMMERITAFVWALAMILPRYGSLFTSNFTMYYSILVIAVALFSARYHVRDWKKYTKKNYDYGNRTKEELVHDAYTMLLEALKSREDMAEYYKKEMTSLKTEAEGYINSGKYSDKDAKKLYTSAKRIVDLERNMREMHDRTGAGAASVNRSALRYFSGIDTKEALDRKYRELAKKMHPDNGGDAAEFADMQTEYRTLKSTF